jgi:hypothetical protein
MFAAPLQCAYPSFRLPAVGEDHYGVFVPLDLYEIACRRWDDLCFAWALKKGYKLGANPALAGESKSTEQFGRTSFYAFLFGRDLPGRVGVPAVRDRDFAGLGLSTLRCNGSMATLHWGCRPEHSEHDNLSFTFYSNNRVLAPDYGQGAGGTRLANWLARGAAHNTVVVDGECRHKSSPGTLVGAHEGNYLHYASASAGYTDTSVEHARKLLLLEGICIVVDSLIGDSAHDFDWIMRFEGEACVAGDPPEAGAKWDHDELLQVDHVHGLGDGRRLDWTSGSGRASLAIWPSNRDGLMAVGTCPAEYLSTRASVVVCRQRGLAAEFVAALAASDHGQMELDREGRVIRIGRADQTDYICVGLSRDEPPAQRLRTDGEVAAVKIVADKVQSVALIGGSVVHWDGEAVLDCPSRVDCAQVCFAERNPIVTYQGGAPGVIRIKTTARAMRVNGHRTAATTSDGYAILRVDSQMLTPRGL